MFISKANHPVFRCLLYNSFHQMCEMYKHSHPKSEFLSTSENNYLPFQKKAKKTFGLMSKTKTNRLENLY